MIRSRRAHGLVALAVLVAALSAAPTLAWAQATGAEKGDAAARAARRELQRAEAAFNLGKFEQALAGYEAAYQAKPLPALLFDIAQCHRHLGNSDRALFFYRRYLALDPNSANRATVDQLIAETERRRDSGSGVVPPPTTAIPPPGSGPTAVAPPPVAAPPLSLSPPPPGPPAVVQPPAEAVSTKVIDPPAAAAADPAGALAAPAPVFIRPTPQPAAEARPSGRRWWIWAAVAGVAVAGAATAFVIGSGPPDPARRGGSLGVIDWQ
jgi:tetratricopeptide (TPR) repeat protein